MMSQKRGPIVLSALELDALRETGNQGAGRAATALSSLLGRPVGIDVPRASILRLEQLPGLLGGPEKVVAATFFRVHGDAPGRLVLVLGEESLQPVLSTMLGRPLVPGEPLSPEALSALKELGNIICSNYLNAMADLVGFPILPSVPALAIDMASSVLESVAADAAQDGAQALLIENRFLETGYPVPLYLFYLPEPGALEALLAGLARSTGVDPRGGRG
jgi:chemotaxis protein CheC